MLDTREERRIPLSRAAVAVPGCRGWSAACEFASRFRRDTSGRQGSSESTVTSLQFVFEVGETPGGGTFIGHRRHLTGALARCRPRPQSQRRRAARAALTIAEDSMFAPETVEAVAVDSGQQEPDQHEVADKTHRRRRPSAVGRGRPRPRRPARSPGPAESQPGSRRRPPTALRYRRHRRSGHLRELSYSCREPHREWPVVASAAKRTRRTQIRVCRSLRPGISPDATPPRPMRQEDAALINAGGPQNSPGWGVRGQNWMPTAPTNLTRSRACT